MSCVHNGLWHFSTSANNDIFQIIEVGAILFEVVAIMFYVKVNRKISVNSKIINQESTMIINESQYEETNDNFEYHKMAKRVQKANKNVILPVYSKLLLCYIWYQIIMIIYSLTILVLSYYQIAIHTITKYIIITFQGFIVNFIWYSFMYLIMWSFIQRSSGTKSWKRSAYISILLGLIHGIGFIFIFYIISNGLITTYITIGLCLFDLFIFFILILYMYKKPRRRYKKSLVCYTITMFIIHMIWIILNVIVVQSYNETSESIFADMYKNGDSSFCIYYIFDVLRQLTFPIILFFTLKQDSEYWTEMALLIMSSNHARLSIWDECVEYTVNSNNNRYNKHTMDTSKTNLAFDEVVNVAQMQIPIFEWACLGIDQSDDDAMNKSYVGIGTSATVLLGKYKGQPVAIKCILCDELDMETMHLFYKEALLSLSLQSKGKYHPNIVQFLGVAIQPPELCLVYEYCKHKSLTNVLQNVNMYPNINYRQILYIALDIAKGMRYLHKNNIVHRDLKTENVLIHEYVQKNSKYPGKLFIAKVCDFGLARKVGNTPHDDSDEYEDTVDDDDVYRENEISSPSTSSVRSNNRLNSSIKSMKSRDSFRSSFENFFSAFGFSKKRNKSKYRKSRGKSLLDEDGYVIDEDPEFFQDDALNIEENKLKDDGNTDDTQESDHDTDDRKYNSPRHKPQFMTTEVGTVAFLPPEILQNISFQDAAMGDVKILNKNTMYAHSIDVFSFGCILWELIMRDEVYKEKQTAEDIRNAVLKGEYPKTPQWCPDNYNNLIKACWERDPLKRPAFEFIVNKLKGMIKATIEYKTSSVIDYNDDDLMSDDNKSIASPWFHGKTIS